MLILQESNHSPLIYLSGKSPKSPLSAFQKNTKKQNENTDLVVSPPDSARVSRLLGIEPVAL